MGPFSLKNLFRREGRRVEIMRDRRRNLRHRPDPGSKILVVDDSRTVRYTMKRMLQQGGFQVLEAADGAQAVELAKRERPRLILMDIVMPEVNGFQATRRIRRAEETASIPIVIMSGDREATHRFWGTRIGANDFMGKPFQRFDLYRRVEKILYDNEISPPGT